MIKKIKINKILKYFFKEDNIKIIIYKKNILKVIKFAKKNYNVLTYDRFFFIFKRVDLDDIKILINLFKSINIKLFEKIPFKYLFLCEENKNIKNSTKFSDSEIKKKYKKINIYLKIISKTFFKNKFLVNDIFNIKKKNFSKLNKVKNIKSNLNSFKHFNFKYFNNNSNSTFFKNKKKNNSMFEKKSKKIIYFKNLYKLNKNFSLLNFLSKNNIKYNLKSKKYFNMIFELFKKKKIYFKINLNILDYFYNSLIKKIKKVNFLRNKIYDNISNISEISYIEFNFFFLNYNFNLSWILNIINYNIINDISFKKNVIEFLKNITLEIKKIKNKYFISLKNLLKIFNSIELYKFKIDIIRNNLIKSKSYLVKNFLKKYKNKSYYEEIIQEGSLSLIKSINNYKNKLNINLNNYIIYNLKKSINKYFYNNRLVSLPSHVGTMFKKINEVVKKYNSTYNIDPSSCYISNKLNINKNKVEEIINLFKDPISINKINNDDETELHELLKSQDYKSFEDEIFNEELKVYIEELILKINDNRSSNIIRMRFGIEFFRKYSLAEIGNVYGISRERIRQIQNDVLKKMRNISHGNRLNNFFKHRNKYYLIKN